MFTGQGRAFSQPVQPTAGKDAFAAHLLQLPENQQAIIDIHINTFRLGDAKQGQAQEPRDEYAQSLYRLALAAREGAARCRETQTLKRPSR